MISAGLRFVSVGMSFLEPKIIGNSLYVDGISMYRMDAISGKIIEHKIENLIVNQTPLSPPFVNLMQREMSMQPQGIPAGAWGMVHSAENQV